MIKVVLEDAAAQLMEYFDSVQIVVTSVTPDGATVRNEAGAGNWYARTASVRSWLEDDRRRDDAEVMAAHLHEDDDEPAY